MYFFSMLVLMICKEVKKFGEWQIVDNFFPQITGAKYVSINKL